ncbi:hypothetical protein F230042K4_08900 [Mediterraneibacter glycyrrhizinilyticus]
MVQNMILKSIFYRQCNNIKHMMMSKSVEKCKKTNEGNTFHEKELEEAGGCRDKSKPLLGN